MNCTPKVGHPLQLLGCSSGFAQVFRRPSDLGEPYSVTVLRMSFSALASVFSTSANSILLPDTSARVSLNTTWTAPSASVTRTRNGSCRAKAGSFCISGVPALGVPKTMTFAGCMSKPLCRAAAWWSMTANTVMPFSLTAVSKRRTVSSKLYF